MNKFDYPLGDGCKIFGTDIDIPIETFEAEEWVDVKEQLEFLAKFLPKAVSVELLVIGRIETKPAYRVRIKGLIKPEDIPE